MIIHKLSVSNYRMIGDPLQLEFPEKGRIGILGQNESGKSTLLESIATALYGLVRGAGISREDLVTWGKEKARLKVEFSSGDHRYLLMREIGVIRGHRAKLIPLINGEKDVKNAISNITEIERKIEEITGMDRDSFTKLVYIRQKDLDALKELYKSKREQLVNKVMGIEVFDQASRNVGDEISEIQKELLEKRPKLDNAKTNKEQYESKLKERQDLDNEVGDLRVILKEKKESLAQKKEKLEIHDWSFKYKSINDLTRSKKDELIQVESEETRLKGLEERLNKYSSIVEANKKKVNDLKDLLPTYQNIEERIAGMEQHIIEVHDKRDELVKSLGLSDKEVEMTSKGLTKEKSRQLRRAGLTALLGILGLLLGLINPILASIGVVLLCTLGYFFIRYLKADKLISRAASVESYDRQINELQDRLKKPKEQIEDLVEKNRYGSSQQIKNELDTVLTGIKNQTGQETFDGLKAVTDNLSAEVNSIHNSDLEGRGKAIRDEVKKLQEQIKDVENIKPEIPDGFSYEEDRHKRIKELFEKARDEYGKVESDIKMKEGLIGKLNVDLQKLKQDFDSFPVLKKEVDELEDKADLLDMVNFELRETSKELRTKIIPQARYVINQILPTFTDGRYSDFEITEDLKFKVHSVGAGDYKEREIFSGGTQDQFLIALRLAFTQSILDSRVMADKYSLLMDECISSSDEVRKQGIFEVLEVMKGTFSQIFIIAHEDISNFVDQHIVLARNENGYTEIKSKSW